MRKYEGLFILKPDIDQEAEDKVVDSIKESISKKGGSITLSEKWGKRKLAYTIDGQIEGIYYRFEFETEPAVITTLKRGYKLNENIVRELITVKE